MLPPPQPPRFSPSWHLSLVEKAPTLGCKLSVGRIFPLLWGNLLQP